MIVGKSKNWLNKLQFTVNADTQYIADIINILLKNTAGSLCDM